MGVHMDSLNEHMDRPDMQRLLGEVLHRTRPFLDSPAPALHNLTEVIMSRYSKQLRLLLCFAACFGCPPLIACLSLLWGDVPREATMWLRLALLHAPGCKACFQ